MISFYLIIEVYIFKFLFKNVKVCKALHTDSMGDCLYNMLVRLPLSDSCCHMAHTCSPKVTERLPFVAPGHPSPAPPHVILREWCPFLWDAHITGVCWRGLHSQQSLYSLWPSLTDTSLNLCLPPSLSLRSMRCFCPCQLLRAGLLEVITELHLIIRVLSDCCLTIRVLSPLCFS